MEKILKVEGMTCGHCEKAVIEALKGLREVSEVVVDLETGEVKVTGNNLIDKLLIGKVEEAGYKVKSID